LQIGQSMRLVASRIDPGDEQNPPMIEVTDTGLPESTPPDLLTSAQSSADAALAGTTPDAVLIDPLLTLPTPAGPVDNRNLGPRGQLTDELPAGETEDLPAAPAAPLAPGLDLPGGGGGGGAGDVIEPPVVSPS
jgi:hypothetical protein